MKVSKEHYEIIKAKIKARYEGHKNMGFTLESALFHARENPKIKNPDRAVLWDLFHASRIDFDIAKLYLDSHIETAMKKIIKEITGYEVKL